MTQLTDKMNIHNLVAISLLAASSLVGNAQDTLQLNLNLKRPTAEADPRMYGVFFEDINMGADGGLYAELVKNRSFEFPQALMGWNAFGQVEVRTDTPCFDRNPHYARISNAGTLTGSGLDNEGFRGIGLKEGETYRFSTYARCSEGLKAHLDIELIGADGQTLCRKGLQVNGTEWKRYTASLIAPRTEERAHLRVVMRSKGCCDMDHISLFPSDTWKGKEGGLRRDLVEALRDLHPGVMRFPGGCVVEGNSLATRYQWKNTIGPVENRPLNENRWNYTFKDRACPDYFQSYGLGFYEFFQLCEDIGARPLPILSVGLSCQYESHEQVPLDSLQPYIQDALDLIEFANEPKESTWGSVRAGMGHPEPFGLQFIGIGNEQWGQEYVERLTPFIQAIRARYPDIQIVGSAGPSADGDKFDYLWPEMRQLGADLVDEHYYMDPQWFLSHADRYDNYPRKGTKVFAGEYASHDHSQGKANNFRAALSEAAFMTGLERNADVVRLATYAPLFAHIDAWQWNPDLIWFDNLRSCRTPNYYVQQLYSLHAQPQIYSITSDGKALTGQKGLYASASGNASTSETVLKLVNAADSTMELCITIQGAKRLPQSGICTYLQSDDLNAVNHFDRELVYPRLTPVCTDGKGRLHLTLPPHFFGVYSLHP